ncbi:UNVERIFIED_CONTAM: protein DETOXIFICATION 25 [Sesamum angustifolium]|uniref:Protein DETOXIFICATION 25 n=1 Tax=Sesamum angustifolium TaxID=2727405 RepID=A0AAW2JJX9_9LAMI
MFFELKKDVIELLDVHRRFRISNSVEMADFESFLLIVPGQGMDSSIQETLLSTEVEQKGDLKGRICEESKKIWRVALPSIVSRVTSFGTIVVTQSFVGHISSVDLAGYALVQTLSVRFVNGIVIGMSSARQRKLYAAKLLERNSIT